MIIASVYIEITPLLHLGSVVVLSFVEGASDFDQLPWDLPFLKPVQFLLIFNLVIQLNQKDMLPELWS